MQKIGEANKDRNISDVCRPDGNNRRKRHIPGCKRVHPINCEASSQLNEEHDCWKAFDGFCNRNNGWASKGEGVGAWIKATLSSEKLVSNLKLRQRNMPGEGNKKVEIEVSPTENHLDTLRLKGDRSWNNIKLSRNVLTKYVKITIKEVYGQVNNGFKEIEIYECDNNN